MLHSQHLPGRHLHQRSFRAKNDIILCGRGYYGGSQQMMPWRANAVNSLERRVNGKPHLQTFEVKTVDWDGGEQQTLGDGSQMIMDPHQPYACIYVAYETKKRCSLCAKKKRTIQFNQVKETEDTCCQAAQRNCLSSSEDSGSVSTCVESTHALILHYMWLHTEKKSCNNQGHVRITAN